MLTIEDLKEIARARLRDAEILHRAGRPDAAGYLAGYALEIALKARICRTLRWDGFPEKAREFEGLNSFRTHDLRLLLRLSGRKQQVAGVYLALWAEVENWNPSDRYRPIGSSAHDAVSRRLIAVRHLMRIL